MLRTDLPEIITETLPGPKAQAIIDRREAVNPSAIKCVYESPKVMDIQAYCKKELETLWPETRRLVNPHKVYVDLSAKLYDIKISLLDQMSAE